MKYDPEIHHRRSIRLKGYDYSQSGYYFITLCCQNREHLFGEIIDGKMVANDAGRMVEKWFYELENKFADISCDAMAVMPNHIHFIVGNTTVENIAVKNVGADLRVCPFSHSQTPSVKVKGEHAGSPLHSVVQWYKTMTTNEYIRGVKNNGWRRFNGKLWQRNYWEHIIRDEKSLNTIRDYIINNPAKWAEDKNNIS